VRREKAGAAFDTVFALCEYDEPSVWVISKRRLAAFWDRHRAAERRLSAWYQVVEAARWSNAEDLKRTFPSADLVGRLVVFNVGGNNYRVIARVEFASHKVFVRDVLTHTEYNTNAWKHDPWF
jgi:mRNA interferase HigB